MCLLRRALLVLFLPMAIHASPLDKLDPSKIPAEERFADHPKELVGIAGTTRGLQWGGINCMTFSPDGKWLAAGTDTPFMKSEAHIWDPRTLRKASVIKAHKGPVRAIGFSPDGKTLVTLADFLYLNEFQDDPVEPRVYFRHQLPNAKRFGNDYYYNDFAFSEDGRLLVTVGVDLKLWSLDPKGPKVVWNWDADHNDWLGYVQFTPDDKSIIVLHVDGIHRVWDATDPKNVKLRLQFGNPEKRESKDPHWGPIAFSPDGKLLYSAGTRQGVQIWDMTREKPAVVGTIPMRAGTIRSMHHAPDQPQLMIGTYSGFTQLWDVSKVDAPQLLTFLRVGEQVSTVVAFGPKGQAATAGGLYQKFHLLDTTDGKLAIRHTITGHRHRARGVTFAPDGKTLVTTCDDGRVRLWDVDQPQPRVRLEFPMHSPLTPAYSPDGKILAVGGSSGHVCLWQHTGVGFVKRANLMFHKNTVGSLAFSPDSKKLITTDWWGEAAQWDLEGKGVVRMPTSLIDLTWTAAGHPITRERILTPKWRNVCGVACSPDGKHLILAGDHLRLVSTKLQYVYDFDRHKRETAAVAFSADGKVLASVCNGRYSRISTDRRWALEDTASDEKARIWEMGDGRPQKMRHAFDGCGDTLALSPNGRLLAAGSTRMGEVFLFDADAGKTLRTWQFPDDVWSLAFAPDNRHLAVSCTDGAVYILRIV